jgi:hypothetical protein
MRCLQLYAGEAAAGASLRPDNTRFICGEEMKNGQLKRQDRLAEHFIRTTQDAP